jgi:outer membrane cobalamin receptor
VKTIGRCIAAGLGSCCLGLLAADTEQERLQLADELVLASPITEGDQATLWGGVITTVSECQIERLNAYDLATALRRTPGVTISRYNRVGSFGGGEGGAVFVRGMGSSRPGGEIVMMLDGVPVGNGLWSHPLLDLASIGPAARIEVYKGPHPTVYGNAFSAVNIVPKSWTEDRPNGRLSLAFGSDATWHQSAEGGGACGPLDFLVGQSTARSDGHRADSDGRQSEAHAQLGWQLGQHWRLAAFALTTDGMANDPGPQDAAELRDGCYGTREWLATLALSHEYDLASGQAKLFLTRGDGEWYDQAGNADDTLSDWYAYGLRLREDIRPWENGEVSLGLDYDATEGEAKFTTDASATSYFDRETLRLLSPFVGLNQLLGDRADWWCRPSVGLRYYTHNVFAEAFAPQAGLTFGHGPAEGHLNYARGINYPGLNVAVFSQNVIAALGDAWRDLDPETLDHIEGGVSLHVGDIATVGLTLFYDEGKDRYVFYRDGGGGPPNAWENIESFRQRGAELTATVRPHESLSLFGGITYLDPDPGDLPYSPEWTVVGGANWRCHPAVELSVDLEWVDRMHVASQARLLNRMNTETVGAHLLLNAKLTYHFQAGERLQGKVFVALENALDENYDYQPDYPMPGFSAMTGLEVSF